MITHGATDYLKEARGNTKSDWFLMNMLQSSQVVTDAKGNAMLIEVDNVGRRGKKKNNYM